MVFKDFSIHVLWANVASALGGLMHTLETPYGLKLACYAYFFGEVNTETNTHRNF